MKRITREQATVCEIDHRLEPLIRVEPGESFVLETQDAAAGYIRDEETLPYPEKRPAHAFSPPRLNPVAGPVFVEGAGKGDVVVVTVGKIIPDTQGYTILQPGDGLFGDSLKYRTTADFFTRILKHKPGPSGTLADGECIFNDRSQWKLSPFIGTICLAPERKVPASLRVSKGGQVYYKSCLVRIIHKT